MQARELAPLLGTHGATANGPSPLHAACTIPPGSALIGLLQSTLDRLRHAGALSKQGALSQ